MEHRALNGGMVGLVRENALATYLGLTGSVEGAVVTRPSGFTLVRAPGVFSFCNFAAGFDIKADDVDHSVELLRRQAEECFGFYVFLMTGDSPHDLQQRLNQAGFELRQRLASMYSTLKPQNDGLPLAEVTDPKSRRTVAAFMAQQFFSRMPREARESIAGATAASPHAIWALGDPAAPEAAVMLTGLPGSVGLFNLCVAPELRRAGLGASVVKWVQAVASASGRPVVLQCEPDLVPWYQGLGFEGVGSVDAYTLAPAADGDILI